MEIYYNLGIDGTSVVNLKERLGKSIYTKLNWRNRKW